MYDVALTVAACLRAGTLVHVAWALAGSGAVRPGTAVALTPGGGRVGTLGVVSLDDQLVDLCTRGVGNGRVVELGRSLAEAHVDDGGEEAIRCLAIPADRLPDGLWGALVDREVVGLATRIERDEVVASRVVVGSDALSSDGDLADLAGRGGTRAEVQDDVVLTVLRPVPRLVVAGLGPMSDAIADAAGLLGWQVEITGNVTRATGSVAGLAPLDKVVVVGHDLDVTGPVLEAALASRAGYIGSVGPMHVQQDRRDWLALRGAGDVSRIHGPAGLEIGASTPAEVAVAVLAEAIAVPSRVPE